MPEVIQIDQDAPSPPSSPPSELWHTPLLVSSPSGSGLNTVPETPSQTHVPQDGDTTLARLNKEAYRNYCLKEFGREPGGVNEQALSFKGFLNLVNFKAREQKYDIGVYYTDAIQEYQGLGDNETVLRLQREATINVRTPLERFEHNIKTGIDISRLLEENKEVAAEEYRAKLSCIYNGNANTALSSSPIRNSSLPPVSSPAPKFVEPPPSAERMVSAVRDVRKGVRNRHQASLAYGVKYDTLTRRLDVGKKFFDPFHTILEHNVPLHQNLV